MKNISKNSKQRLLEVMSKVNGLNLNENYPMGAEYDPNAPWNQKDDDENVVEPEEFDAYDKHKDDSMDETSSEEETDINISQNQDDSKLLKEIKRLRDYIDSNSPTINVVAAILDYMITHQEEPEPDVELNPEETPEQDVEVNQEPDIDESKWGKTRANPKYTHFAVLKDNNKIVTGWEYRGYDPEELRLEKKHYFLNDVKDLQVDPKIVKIVTTKGLQKLGIDPYDYNNWSKDDSIFTLEENKVSE